MPGRSRTLWFPVVAIVAASCGNHMPIGPVIPMPAAAMAVFVATVLGVGIARRHGLLPADVE